MLDSVVCRMSGVLYGELTASPPMIIIRVVQNLIIIIHREWQNLIHVILTALRVSDL